MPGLRNCPPIRLSMPIPRATSWTSAPAASQRFATTLINEIFIARNAFEACLMISALCADVNRMGAGSKLERCPGTALSFS